MVRNRLQFEQIGLATEKGGHPDHLFCSIISGAITGDSIMKYIPLTQGQFAIIDDDKYDYLNQWKWCALKVKNTFYAVRNRSRKLGKCKIILMHREILNVPPGLQTDHKNMNGLDNRKENIRVCTRSQNNMNRLSHGGTSKYKGVSRNKGKWVAQIKINKKTTCIGHYENEIEAAKKYDNRARQIFGEFARMNF